MSINSIYNESILLREIQSGSEQAFTTMYRHYSPQIYVKVFSILKDQALAEELVQEVFTRIWQKRTTLDANQNFTGYLSTIAVNALLDCFRKIKRDLRLRERFINRGENHYQHIEEGLIYKETTHTLHKAMQRLSPQQFKVYQLCKLEGYSYKEVADKLGISTFTVKEYLIHANKVIRMYMANHWDSGSVLMMLLLAKKIIE